MADSLTTDLAGHSRLDRIGRWLALLIVIVWAVGFAVGFVRAVQVLFFVSLLLSMIGLVRPSLGMLGVGMLCTIDPLSRVYLMSGGLFRWNTFNYWLMIVIVLAVPLLLKLRGWQVRLVQAFIAVLGVGLLQSRDVESGLQHMLGIVALLGLLVYFIRGGRDTRSWYWMGLLNGLVAAVGGLIYFLRFHSLPTINPNAWVYFPLTGLFSICLAAHAVKVTPRERFALQFLAVMNAIWIYLTGSRGGMLSGVFCLLFLLSKVPGTKRRTVYAVCAAMLSVVLVLQFREQQSYSQHRLDKAFNSEYTLASRTSGRSELMKGGWRMFVQNPIGVGTGSFASEWEQLENWEEMSDWGQNKRKQAHSGWIRTLAENGLPGLTLQIAFVLSFLVIGWQQRYGQGWLFGAVVCAVLMVSFLSTAFQGKGLWLLSGGAMTLLNGWTSRHGILKPTPSAESLRRFKGRTVYHAEPG